MALIPRTGAARSRPGHAIITIIALAALALGFGAAVAAPEAGAATRDGWSTIQAEGYDASGGSLQVCGGVLCYVAANAWTQYNGVDLHTGTNAIQFSVANGGGNSGIQVWVGGVNTGTLTVGGTGGWNSYQTKTLTLPPQNSTKDVKLVFLNGNVNVDWFMFSSTGSPTPTPTPTPTVSPTPTPTPTGPPG
ncbi:carbohydrate-binding protein, partial [Sphaerisporangium rufum]|uniref:carbohydrate-binding protein n=1 Tax=Sphaerisporangium rufum TaxID=1381558 RepID=UPI00194E97E7